MTRAAMPDTGDRAQQGHDNRERGTQNHDWCQGRHGGCGSDRQTSQFEGQEPSLKNAIFDYNGSRNADQFI